jgi:crotonobetainyl-CoA:carnitine CoA-transferase CaiB-like acyl-CoA transferase
MLAALHRKRVTGKGCWIDASQAETGIYLTGTAVLDYAVNGRSWARYGNRSPYKASAPHGIYPTVGDDRWIAISCFTEHDWHALLSVLGRQDWASMPQFRTLTERVANQDELDRLVAEATTVVDPYDLMKELQTAGVAAGVCQTAEDRCDHDPQLAHLQWMVELEQSEIGTWPVKEVPVHLAGTPAYIGGPRGRHGPSYGEDNGYVLGELLGLSESEQAELAAEGVVTLDERAGVRAGDRPASTAGDRPA